jgi:hypothetical protein
VNRIGILIGILEIKGSKIRLAPMTVKGSSIGRNFATDAISDQLRKLLKPPQAGLIRLMAKRTFKEKA